MTEQCVLRSAPAAERNFQPILGVLRREFKEARRVVEIGAGTGQHAAGFASELSWLTWLPTDRQANLADIHRWYEASARPNLEMPQALDVSSDTLPAESFDAAFSANTAHIMDTGAVKKMFRVLGDALEPGGRFCLYGPFRENGAFSTESNARFDASLRATDPSMGIRDLVAVDADAEAAGFRRVRRFAMPGNNLMLVFERGTGSE